MVGRDGIEPPTPGFSGLVPESRKCTYPLNTQGRGRRIIVRWSALVLAQVVLRWARFGHTSQCATRGPEDAADGCASGSALGMSPPPLRELDKKPPNRCCSPKPAYPRLS